MKFDCVGPNSYMTSSDWVFRLALELTNSYAAIRGSHICVSRIFISFDGRKLTSPYSLPVCLNTCFTSAL